MNQRFVYIHKTSHPCPLLFLFALFAIILAAGCRKKGTFHLKPETLSYCNFKIGSLWVYRDQEGRIDTVKIEGYLRKMTSRHTSDEIETVLMTLAPSKAETLTSDEVDILQDQYSVTVYHSQLVGSNYMGTIYREKLDSLENFKGEIKHFEVTNAPLPDSVQVTDEYRMKNVGVIRRIFKDGRQQDLIDYKVIQDYA